MHLLNSLHDMFTFIQPLLHLAAAQFMYVMTIVRVSTVPDETKKGSRVKANFHFLLQTQLTPLHMASKQVSLNCEDSGEMHHTQELLGRQHSSLSEQSESGFSDWEHVAEFGSERQMNASSQSLDLAVRLKVAATQ